MLKDDEAYDRGDLAVALYEDEMWHLREEDVLRQLPIALQDIILLHDMDTELCMNGILCFLENSTGRYLDETIEALGRIGAARDAMIFANIREIMKAHGVTNEGLGAELDRHMEYEIVTFRDVHGAESEGYSEAICKEADGLYVYQTPEYREREGVMTLLQEYIRKNLEKIVAELKRNGLA